MRHASLTAILFVGKMIESGAKRRGVLAKWC